MTARAQSVERRIELSVRADRILVHPVRAVEITAEAQPEHPCQEFSDWVREPGADSESGPRVERTDCKTTPPQQFRPDTPGMTATYPAEWSRDRLDAESES